MNSHFQSSAATWTLIGLGVARSYEPTQATPPTRITVRIGIDQMRSSSRPEYSNSGKYSARVLEARYHQATPSVASIVGMQIASMMPVALNMICRSAAAIGPCGSSTPSLQPPRVRVPSNATARRTYRISGSHRADEHGHPSADDCGRFAAGIEQQHREQREQVKNGKSEQTISRSAIRPATVVQLKGKRDEDRSADHRGSAIEPSGKAKRPRQQRDRRQDDAVDEDLSGRRGTSGDD